MPGHVSICPPQLPSRANWHALRTLIQYSVRSGALVSALGVGAHVGAPCVRALGASRGHMAAAEGTRRRMVADGIAHIGRGPALFLDALRIVAGLEGWHGLLRLQQT